MPTGSSASPAIKASAPYADRMSASPAIKASTPYADRMSASPAIKASTPYADLMVGGWTRRMAGIRTTFAVARAALAVVPAAARAAAKPQAQPLEDVAPLGTDFRDRVTSSNPRLAHAS